MNVAEANFDDILSFYFLQTEAKAMWTQLLSIPKEEEDWWARVARHHEEREIVDKQEIQTRDAFDDLIVFCNVLEVSITGGLIRPPDAGSDFWKSTLSVLTNRHFRKYYAINYPERLPQILLHRIGGDFRATEDRVSQDILLEFLHMDRRFVMNHRNGYLLKLLDSFSFGGQRFSHLLELLEEPEMFVNSLMKNPEERKLLDVAAWELSAFFEFCFNLDELLSRAGVWPILQSEIWARYSYWFEIIEADMHPRLNEALHRFASWEHRGGNEDSAKEIRNYIERAGNTLDSLFSKKYSRISDALLIDLSKN